MTPKGSSDHGGGTHGSGEENTTVAFEATSWTSEPKCVSAPPPTVKSLTKKSTRTWWASTFPGLRTVARMVLLCPSHGRSRKAELAWLRALTTSRSGLFQLVLCA